MFTLLKANGIPSILDIVKIIFPELIIIIPLFLYLSYQALSYNLNQKSIYQNMSNNYLNKLLFSTGGIILYAIIIVTCNNFIKI